MSSRPVAWYAAHVHGSDYAVFLCGLDCDYVLAYGAYRQTLYRMVHLYQLALRAVDRLTV